MSRKSSAVLANSIIAIASVAGGLVLTNHYSAEGTSGGGSTVTVSAKTGTATSDAIPYEFGEVQLTVTEKSGKITAIDTGTSSATGGREQAFSYLVQDAIAANGTNFANLSGATYTTDAFKQALTSAIARLG